MTCCRHHISISGEPQNPTLKVPANVDIEQDCLALHDAMKGIGTDEAAIIDILGHRSQEQRLQIRNRYKGDFGNDLIDQLRGELNSHFKELVTLLLTEDTMIKAKALYEAIHGGGTDEKTIIEILCVASKEEIHQIKEAYQTVLKNEGVGDPSRTLDKDIENDLSGYFQRLVVALLQGQRHDWTRDEVEMIRSNGLRSVINSAEIEKDVDDIYLAGEGRLGTDEATFIRIFASRNAWELKCINDLYEAKTGTPLVQAVENETSGDFKRALLTTLSGCVAPMKTYSEMLRKSMEGLGTRDSTLMRIIVLHCETDLGDISRQFLSDQGKSLVEWVQEDTSGDYEELLVALLGE